MSDEITVTPASLREHADYVFETGVDASVAHALRGMADEMEAESAREGHLLELAEIAYSAVAEYAELDVLWDDLDGLHQGAYMAGAQAVLDHCAGGRLLPEGGTANVVDLHHNHAFGNDSEDCQACRQRSAMAPPAASVPEGGTVLLDDCPAEDDSYGPDFAIPCILVAGHSGDHLASSGDRIAYRWAATPPAVSVPDSTHPYFVWEQGYMASLEDAQGGADGSPDHPFTSNPYSLGEPVAAGKRAADVPVDTPDGTPEKPWRTADDIPADVEVVRDRVGKEWRRKRGGWCHMTVCLCVNGVLDTDFAPFVRVDGGRA